MARLTDVQLAAWVEASCARHGVPVKVTDTAIAAQVAVLLQGRASLPAAARRVADRLRSQTPDQIDSAGVQFASTGLPGTDHGVVEHRTNDRVLPGDVQVLPLSA
jgi:hypothetical protein